MGEREEMDDEITGTSPLCLFNNGACTHTYVYTHVNMHTHTHIHTYTNTNMHTHAYTNTNMHTLGVTCVYMLLCINTQTRSQSCLLFLGAPCFL